MEQLWKKNLISIAPYVPGEQPRTQGIVKLNANENPYPPAPGVTAVLRDFSAGGLRYYPDAECTALKDMLAAYHHVKRSNLFVANGSDDVLALCFQAFFRGKLPIRYPDITYSFYPVWSKLFQVPYETIPLGGDFHINPRDYDGPCGGLLLPNPNAPTAIGEGEAFLIDLLEHHPECIVLVDEAYVDFGCFSAVELTERYENLLVVRTFSKSRSLAGMRLGYAVGSETLVTTLEAVKNSYNSYPLDSIAQAVAVASIQDEAYFRSTIEKVKATRQRVTKELRRFGFTVPESAANFILMTRQDVNAAELFSYLKTKQIYVRYFNLPRIDNHLRVTIGTDSEMDLFLNEVALFLSKNKRE